VLEIEEHATGREQGEDLSVERALAVVREVVDGEAGDDGVELAKRRQRIFEVVRDDGDGALGGEEFLEGLQHGGGEVERDEACAGTGGSDEGKKSSAAAADVENAARGCGHEFKQGGFAFNAVRDGVGAAQVFEGVLSG